MMEKAQKKTPNLRFKGFTDDWEQRKLGKVIVDYKKKNNNDRLPVLTSSFQGIEYQEKHFGSKQKHDTSDYNVLPKGYMTYRNRSDNGYFKFNINKLGVTGIVSKFYPVFTTIDTNKQFLASYMNYNYRLKNHFKVVSVGTSQHVLSLRNLKKTDLLLPSKSEQDQIGEFFNLLNKRIDLQQRKLDLLKQLKKGLLQKMFAAEKNSKQPALRFKGFHDDWEQHKLGDALEEFSYGLNTPATKFDGKNKYLRITDIDDDTHAFNQISLTSPKDKDDNYILGQGDILFARTGASVGKTYMYKANDGKVYYAGFLIKGHIKNGFSTEFIFNTTRLPQYQNFVKVTSMRSGQPGINAKEYQNYVIYVPVKQEQERIGQLISKLDTLITLHQQKLNKLNNLKQGLLQQMFI